MIINEESIIELYENVLNKNRKWPVKYWDGESGIERARVCVRYMLEDLLFFEDRQLENKITKSTFLNYKLKSMLNKVYSGDPKKAIIDVLPEKAHLFLNDNLLNMKIKQIKNNIPLADHPYIRRQIIVDILECEECELDSDIPKKISLSTIYKYGIQDIFTRYYNNSIFKLIDEVKPNVFKPWEFDNIDRSFTKIKQYEISLEHWKIPSNIREAIEWICINKLKLNKIDISLINVNLLEQYNLNSLLRTYDYDLFKLLNLAYPNKINPYDINFEAPKYYWINNEQAAKESLKYVINKYAKNKDDIIYITRNHFKECFLSSLLETKYNNFVFYAMKEIYLDEINDKKWEFIDIPEEIFESKKERLDALTWLFSKVGKDKESIMKNLNQSIFEKYNFEYLFKKIYKENIFLVIDEYFESSITIEEFKKYNNSNILQYTDIFKPYRKCNLTKITHNTIHMNSELLNNLFKITTKKISYAYRGAYTYDTSISEKVLLNEIMKGNVYFYEYSDIDMGTYNTDVNNTEWENLCKGIKIRTENTIKSYWNAYSFFKKYDLFLQNNSAYMQLCTSNSLYEIEKCNDMEFKKILDKYTSIVRCGKVEINRLIVELNQGLEFLWIFPAENIHKPNYSYHKYAYLLQFNQEARYNIINSILD